MTGTYLFLCKLRDSEEFSVCKESPDNLEHYFYYGVKVSTLWADLKETAILGKPDSGIVFNILLLWTGLYI